jgi:hypothetical protein
MHMGNPGVKKTIETLDQADDFDLQLVRPNNGAMDGSVHGRGITARSQNPNSFHDAFQVRWGVRSATAIKQ